MHATTGRVCLAALLLGVCLPLVARAETPAKDANDPNSAPAAPKVSFFTSDANASHVIYVIDRSGSMAPTFPQVRHELLKSINKLNGDKQDFHILLFADNEYVEGPRKMLIRAEQKNKDAAGDFLKDITASGATTVLPALKRAMTAMKYGDPRMAGRVIYLLSDGDFAGMSGGSTYTDKDGNSYRGNEAVIHWLRDNNPKQDKNGRVKINTLLYLSQDEEAMKVMKTISEESGGTFTLIKPEE